MTATTVIDPPLGVGILGGGCMRPFTAALRERMRLTYIGLISIAREDVGR